MAGDTRSFALRLWRPAGLADNSNGLTNHRLLLATLFAGVVSLVCLFVVWPALLAARFLFHLPVPNRLLSGVFVVAMATSALIQALRVWMLFRAGAWKALDGRTLHRTDHPRRFWIWAVVQTFIAAIWLSATGFLAWSLLR